MDAHNDPADQLPTVLLTGTAGVGKSIVAKELHELLRRAGRSNAMIDLDAIGRVYPSVDRSMNAGFVLRNLQALWPNYRELRLDHLVLARVVTTPAELDAYRSLPGIDLRVVRLAASADTVRQRIEGREPGISRGFLVRLAAELDDPVSTLGSEGVVIDNDADRNVTEVAVEVLRWLGWPVSVDVTGPVDRDDPAADDAPGGRPEDAHGARH